MSCYLNQKNMKSEITGRIKSPTPKFFKKIRTIGLTLGAIGGALLAAPITLPATVVTIAGYLATAGIVASAVSTVAKEDKF
jgi:ABC-type xylose transport system permease subunit